MTLERLVPPDCEGEGEPDGDGVDDHGEVDVDPHEDAPAPRELVLQRPVRLDEKYHERQLTL